MITFHLISGVNYSVKEIFLFNDTRKTFYSRLYGVKHNGKESFRLAAIGHLYAPSHIEDSTYHGPSHISHGALAGMRNSSMGSL